MRNKVLESHDVSIGILMLETHFSRILRDIGNAQTWPVPVQYRKVKGASADMSPHAFIITEKPGGNFRSMI